MKTIPLPVFSEQYLALYLQRISCILNQWIRWDAMQYCMRPLYQFLVFRYIHLLSFALLIKLIWTRTYNPTHLWTFSANLSPIKGLGNNI